MRDIEAGIDEIKKAQEKDAEANRELYRELTRAIISRGESAPRSVKIEKRRCPICGRVDSDWSGNVHNLCRMSSDDADKIWDIKVEYSPLFRQYDYSPKSYSEGATVGRVKIIGNNISAFASSDLDDYNKNTIQRLKEIRTLIVSAVDNIEIDERVLNYLIRRTPNATRIILASNVSFVCKNANIGWVYDSRLGKLTKK